MRNNFIIIIITLHCHHQSYHHQGPLCKAGSGLTRVVKEITVMKLEPNLHHKLCTTITMMIITIIINILTSYILTFNLVFEICFGRFLVSCPPDFINCYRILLLSSNSINRFSKRSIIYINIYEKRDKFNFLPMDWDFSSLPWEESFLKGGSHFLEKSISFNILRRSSLWWSPCKHLF